MLALMGVIRILGRLRTWTTGHWIRGVMVAGSILSLIGLTIGGWAYLATVALNTGQLTADAALAAYDEGNYEEARNMVGHMLTGGVVPRSDYGTPLFVLGAIKTRDAENQAVPERRRVEYLIASRYLTEARAYGFPVARERQGVYLLGHSLIESGQFDEGIGVLKEVAGSEDPADQAANHRDRAIIGRHVLDDAAPEARRSFASQRLAASERAPI